MMIISGVAIAALIIGVLSLIASILTLIEYKAFNKSTHQIQYVTPEMDMPISKEGDTITSGMSQKDINKALNDLDDGFIE